MTDQVTSTTKPPVKQFSKEFKLQIAGYMLVGFSVTVLFLSTAYIKDIETLQQIPELVWGFICGVPNQSDTTLPLLLTISTLALLGGIGLLGFGRWISRRQSSM